MKNILVLLVAAILAACGADGKDGYTTLVRLDEEPAGENCQEGGTAVHYGIDDDGDGNLAESEITSTSYVCNGSDGTSGLYLESSDGKYIGDLVGIANPHEFQAFMGECVFAYNSDLDGMFGVLLGTAEPCLTLTQYFSSPGCDFASTIWITLHPGTHWRLINPASGEIFAPGSEVTSFTFASRIHGQTRECIEQDPPETVDVSASTVRVLVFDPTGEFFDFGEPPVLIK